MITYSQYEYEEVVYLLLHRAGFVSTFPVIVVEPDSAFRGRVGQVRIKGLSLGGLNVIFKHRAQKL